MQVADATRRELLALEKQYWNAIMEKDARTATSLSDDPCVVVDAPGCGRGGQTDPYQDDGGREVRPGGILARGRAHASDPRRRRRFGLQGQGDLVVDGEKVKLEAFDSSVSVRRGKKWVCVIHTESLAGDPFGRQ